MGLEVMARVKMIDGRIVPMSAAEEAQRNAEDAAYAAQDHTPKPAPRARVELIEAALIEKGALTKADIDGQASK